MKQLFILLASSTLALSQSASIPSVASMTPEMMEKALNDRSLIPGGRDIRFKLFTEAIALERMDLIKTCLLNRHIGAFTYRSLVALPDNDLRAKTTIMMLRMPTLGCWPVLHLTTSSVPLPTDVSEPFISTTAKLLPEETLKKEMLATQVERDKLADKLLAALIAKGISISTAERALLEAAPEAVPARPSSVSSTAQSTAAQVPHTADANPFPNTAPSPQPQAELQARHLWWITGGALAVIVLAWLALKKCS